MNNSSGYGRAQPLSKRYVLDLIDLDCGGVLVEYQIDCAETFRDECTRRGVTHVDGTRVHPSGFRDTRALILATAVTPTKLALALIEECRKRYGRERVYLTIVAGPGVFKTLGGMFRALSYTVTLRESPVLFSVVGGRVYASGLCSVWPEELIGHLSFFRWIKRVVIQYGMVLARLGKLDYVLFRT